MHGETSYYTPKVVQLGAKPTASEWDKDLGTSCFKFYFFLLSTSSRKNTSSRLKTRQHPSEDHLDNRIVCLRHFHKACSSFHNTGSPPQPKNDDHG